MKMKHLWIWLIVFVAIAFGLLLWNRRSIAIKYHASQRLADFYEIYRVGPQGNQRPQIEEFEQHQEALVRLKYFFYEKIPFTRLQVPSNESKMLFAEINKQTPIERGYFKIHGYGDAPDEIEIWGTTDQLSVMKSIIAKYESGQRATETDVPADTDKPRR